MPNKTSQHILSTAANLLGFCLIIITSLHIADKTKRDLVDEFASATAILLIFSCILSFASLKTQDLKKEKRLEKLADILFLSALSGILLTILYLALRLWNK